MNIIDWTRIKTIDDILKLDENLLFDEAEVISPENMLKLNPNLTEDEIKDAQFWANYTRGLMLVTGEPGAGKGIFSYMVSYKMRYYFNKQVVLDTRPRKSFGNYIPFSEDMVGEQVERMSLLEKGYGKVMADGRWIAYNLPKEDEEPEDKVRGEIFLRNSVVFLDEFGSKYMPRLTPSLSISQVLGKLFDFWRHMQCLMIGVGVSTEDFNRRALDKAIWEAKCVRVYDTDEQEEDPDVIIIGVYLTPVKFNPFNDEISKAGDIIMLRINASEPKPMLGGLRWCDIYNTDNVQGFSLPHSMRQKGRKKQ